MLGSLLDNYPLFTDASVLDPSGREVYSLGRFHGPADPSPGAWALVVDGVRKRGWSMEDPGLLPGGLVVMRVCVPIEREPGEVLGYLGARANLADLDAKLRGFDSGGGGLAYLADAAGRVLSGSWEKYPFPDGFKVPAEMLDPSWTEGEYERPDGEKVLAVKAPVPGAGWVLVSELPAAVALRPVVQFRRRIFGALVLAGVLALALCLCAGRSNPWKRKSGRPPSG